MAAKSHKEIYKENIQSKDEINHKISRLLKKNRKKRGFPSYKRFAEELGISKTLYGRYENGQDLRVSTLIKIVQGMGVKVSDFFSEFDN
ncbi:Helix-turn-helix [Chitinophaga terrae (ex Kim and Jung 2007)]|uniref:Helix-turn-helix n=1 Tax=Chitinophaga terrae (ex Kim and Jung 2007) TaxID=408074 RepID=A0A1H4GBV4_9BACT|nr:helix-turn-helix transcriptional regulator [Chitinophaga terrae (ex Kim and Jung 2007)]SEB07113.1 Helix-turn-helix [Chitinophaga terrae (ex Kim and Jung 2007)]